MPFAASPSAWRLLVVSEPGLDGVFVCVRSLIRHLHARHPEIGVDLAFSSLRHKADDPDGLMTLVREVRERGGVALDLRVGNAPQARDVAAAAQLLQLAKQRGTRLVHAHSSKAGALARLCALVPGFPPVLYTPHAYYGMARQGGGKERLFNIVETLLGHIGVTHNCSEDELGFARQALGVPTPRLMLLHHGIDTQRFAPSTPEERVQARRALGLSETSKWLVTIGRVSTQKNYAPLYTAMAAALPGSGWSFAHAGAGSSELCAALPAQHARGFEHLPDTSLLLRAADGFIMTSRYEGLSLSTLHALSCGLPMLLTRAPGLRTFAELGFDQIRWLPDPAVNNDLVPAIHDAFASLAAEAPTTSYERQRALACELFDEPRNLERLVQLATQLAQR